MEEKKKWLSDDIDTQLSKYVTINSVIAIGFSLFRNESYTQFIFRFIFTTIFVVLCCLIWDFLKQRFIEFMEKERKDK